MHNGIFSIVLSVIFLKGTQSSCPSTQTTLVDGYRFWRVDDRKDFDSSDTACILTYGAKLAIIRSNETSKAVNSIIRECNDMNVYYFGLEYVNGGWIWQDNNMVLNENEARWDEGEGSNVGNSGCACVSTSESWKDEPCSSDHPYICQRDLLSITVDDEVIWTFLYETVNITLLIRSDEGAVNITLYKNYDTNRPTVVDVAYDVINSSYTYVIENVTAADNGTYTFVATREGYSRSTTSPVSVQDRAAILNAIPVEIQSPVTRGSPNISCITKGIPAPKVYWTKDNLPVNGVHGVSRVYQTTTNFGAVLHFGDSEGSDDGIYTCVAKNVVQVKKEGETVQEDSIDTEETKLRVFGRPTIVDVALMSCSLNGVTIDVSWMPNNQTLGINHMIQVKENSGQKAAVQSQNETSIGGIVSNIFSGLRPNITYVITVTVCPDDCIKFLSDNTTFAVEDPEPVTNVNVTQRGNGDEMICEVQWSFTKTMPKNDSAIFKIIESSMLVNLQYSCDPQQVTGDIEVKSTNNKFYRSHPKPNHNYTFDVYVSNCAGDSVVTRAEGDCITEVSGSSQTASPTPNPLSNDAIEQRTIVIQKPSEENGPISCLFVIVRPGGGQVNRVENLTKLRNLSETATSSKSSPTEGKEYIAVAIPMYQVCDHDNLVVVLGDNENSYCDVLHIGRVETKQGNVYEGVNWELLDKMEYRVSVVSTTPGDSGDVYFGQSNSTEFIQQIVPPSDWVWIMLVSIAVAMLLCFAGLAVYYTKSLKKTDRPKNIQDDPYEVVEYARASTTVNHPSNNASNHSSPTALLPPNLASTFRSFNENGGEKFSAEFEDLKHKTESFDISADVGSSKAVKKKNRYKNVLPYDHSRVSLVGGNGSDIETYINASYINGFERPRKFIATQGPLSTTVQDFWKMVMQEKSKVIIMATNLSENRKKKCECYWPDSTAPQVYGNVRVYKVSERKIGGYMKREFELSDRFGTHAVVQYQLLNWPDHGVPISTSSFLRFYKACIGAQGNGTEPVIVHCSAGAGRTGTFIAYDYLIHQAAKENSVDIFECVLKMRAQRMDMVQNCDQYKFIYRLLAEFHIIKEADVDADAFYAKPSLHNPTSNDLQNQLKTLDLASSFERIAADKVSFQLSVSVTWRPEDGDTIARFDAVKIETYEDTFHLIASAPPTKSTAETFWRLNLDNDVSYIVSISDPTMQSLDYINECWPSEDNIKQEFRSLTVELKVAEEKRHFHIRDLFVRRDSSLQTKEIRHYKMIKWRPKVVFNIIKDIKRSCELLPGSKVKRVLVHCRRGFGETGSFCALVNLTARLEAEGRVDVLRTVKDLKDANIRLVEDTKQYKFCYDALKSYDPPKSRRNTGRMTNPQNNSAYQNGLLTTTL